MKLFDFRITNRVNIRIASKFLFVLTIHYKESKIAFFDLFNLFNCLLIILINCNSFEHDDVKSLGIIINIDLKSMQIIIFLNTSLGTIIKHIKMFYLKLFIIYFKTNSKFIVINVYS